MKAIVTVLGKDKVGINAFVCNILAARNVNILDISQTLMQDMFTMVMVVDVSGASESFANLSETLKTEGLAQQLEIRIARKEIFDAMHRI